jgi:NADH-quinone oxidoreductase subunit J
MLTVFDILFYSFALVAIVSAVLVIFVSNPIYSALFLALTMSVLGAIFFTLEAYFVSVAQITVYAGAVMVLFVMVLMLFDLKQDQEEVLKVSPLTIIKLLSTALLCGFFVGTGWLAVSMFSGNSNATVLVSQKTAPIEKKENVVGAKSTSPEDEDLTSAEASSLVDKEDMMSTTSLSKLLFTNYVFEFESVSLLLLVAIVGAVALAKSKGGTHHVSR